MPGDSEFGIRVRPYMVTGGRTDVHPRLRLDSTVAATGLIDPCEIRDDHAAALRLCARPASVAEVAAGLGQPVQVAKVLVSDLLAHAALAMRSPPVLRADSPRPDFLEAVLDGLKKL